MASSLSGGCQLLAKAIGFDTRDEKKPLLISTTSDLEEREISEVPTQPRSRLRKDSIQTINCRIEGVVAEDGRGTKAGGGEGQVNSTSLSRVPCLTLKGDWRLSAMYSVTKTVWNTT